MSPSNQQALRRALLFVVLLLPPQYLLAADSNYISREQIDLSVLLAPPPAPGSPAQQAEIRQLLALQQTRTPEQEALAQADTQRSVLRFADVFGPDFTAGKCPRTVVLFKKANDNARYLMSVVKNKWNRPRPFLASGEIKPCIPKPNNPSYPSEHSTFASLAAVLLTTMIPEKQTEIFARAEIFRDNRLIGGVHYPSDVEAGRIAGTVIAAFLLRDAAFMAEFAAAKAEMRGALGLP